MITGIWDDHDYGLNNGDKNYEGKDTSKRLYLEFLDDHLSDRTKHDGLYHSYTFGDNGKTVKLILIDIRYFSDSLTDNLGDEQ